MNRRLIVGIDEVGRGCLAGPVVAAAVILDPSNPVQHLADSKSLTALRRSEIAEKIREKALFWSLGRAEASEIDQLNILQASLLAMTRSIQNLTVSKSVWVRVDGTHYPNIDHPGETVVKGDQTVAEISAASILAKVYRDDEMDLLAHICSGYGFSRNKGYPTLEHREALRKQGITPFHRLSFGPVKKYTNSVSTAR